MADAVIRITADDTQASRVLKEFQSRLEGLTQSIPIDGFEKFGAVFRTAGPFAAGAATITAVLAGTKALVHAVDDLDERAQGLGTTAIALDEMTLSARFAGVEADTLARALGDLNTKAAEAFGGNSQAAAAFNAIGVSVKDLQGNLKPTEQLLGDVSDKVKSFRDDSAKGALLAELFGQKVGPRLAAFLNQGSDALRVNTGLTKEAVDEAVRAQREIDKSTASWEKLKNTLTLFSAKGFNAVHDFFVSFDNLEPVAKLERLNAQLQTLRQERDAAAQGIDPRRGQLVDVNAINQQIEAVGEQIKQQRQLQTALDATNAAKTQAPKLNFGVDDSAKRFLAQAESAAQLVDQLNLAQQAFDHLSESEKAELFISQKLFDPRLAGSQQLTDTIREQAQLTDQLVDNAEHAADLAKGFDALSAAFGKTKTFGDDLDKTLFDLSGRAEDIKKIELTEALERMLARNADAFTPEELDKIVLGIAGISEQSVKANDDLEQLGKTISATFARAVVGGEDLGQTLKRLIAQILEIQLDKSLQSVFTKLVTAIGGGFSGSSTSSNLGSQDFPINSDIGGVSATSVRGGGIAKAAGASQSVVVNQFIDARNGDAAGIQRAAATLKKQTLAQADAQFKDQRARKPSYA